MAMELRFSAPKSAASHTFLHHHPSSNPMAITHIHYLHFSQSKSVIVREKREKRSSIMNWMVKAASEGTSIVQEGDWGEPISLGTAKLPPDVDLQKLETLLFQWGNSLTQNAYLPLPAPIRVDKVDYGVRLGYIKVTAGVIESLVHIDILVLPATANSQAMFRAVRNGRLKDMVPPGEPVIMQSLLQALKTSIDLART
ncbi:hypothetical protein O6H91_12G002400 [Diphasiastrum complanatum]|uniref:Uncharacterized protein n=1 Tax=Diphasiastrum complanatum TaxID=34168 RepID=A0ACC2BYA2_DIPCM|nr:hypothetical protein O6H91_12G002400 [Diphasiastrum complanatum]